METYESSFKIYRICREINHSLVVGKSSEEIMDFLFDALRVLIPYDRLSIALLEEGGKTVRSEWVRANREPVFLSKGYAAALQGSSLEEILKTGRPRIIDDLKDYLVQHPKSESTRLVIEDGIRSSLTCPLINGSERIGFVFFSSEEPRKYTQEHLEKFSDIANEFSLIVEQSRLQRFFLENRNRARNVRTAIHDLRNPLSVIQGMLEICEDEAWYASLGPSDREIFNALKRNAKSMQDLLEDMGAAGALDEAKRTDASETDLAELLRVLEESGRTLARRKGIEFVTLFASDLPASLLCHSRQIQQAAENLFANAVKFSHPGTRIHFEVFREGASVLFKVRDQGLGIPENEQSKLFRDFGKTSVRPTNGESSTGLGLAIVKRIVESHGGKVGVVSEAGKGSAFWFALPSRPLN